MLTPLFARAYSFMEHIVARVVTNSLKNAHGLNNMDRLSSSNDKILMVYMMSTCSINRKKFIGKYRDGAAKPGIFVHYFYHIPECRQ